MMASIIFYGVKGISIFSSDYFCIVVLREPLPCLKFYFQRFCFMKSRKYCLEKYLQITFFKR